MDTEKYAYKFDPAAAESLKLIFGKLADNPSAAADLLQSFKVQIDRLRNLPESGTLCYEDIRRIPIQHYRLYYIPLHEHKTIHILAVTRSAPNLVRAGII